MDGDVGGRRSGLLFNVVGNVLGLLVSGARWYGMSLYALDDVLSLAGDVGWSLSAFCGVRRDFNPDILGGLVFHTCVMFACLFDCNHLYCILLHMYMFLNADFDADFSHMHIFRYPIQSVICF
ncbi:uncharacterized protein LOC120353055 isoform X1 [Nilaparvata lugens]|uniref:uncharacterized protein LOC120353055 isoform X1 n=1 Tax=Nilaparvata lugens TaxID=108931 RepID=UPI00193D8C16|nr:uncharacterized protein LOC120353055 isoform X1 [Nilaparvata lugens]